MTWLERITFLETVEGDIFEIDDYDTLVWVWWPEKDDNFDIWKFENNNWYYVTNVVCVGKQNKLDIIISLIDLCDAYNIEIPIDIRLRYGNINWHKMEIYILHNFVDESINRL